MRTKSIMFFLTILISLLFSAQSYAASDQCHPPLPKSAQNYIIGYGSLMNDESRAITNPNVKNVFPILVKNFERTWGVNSKNYKTTFLIVTPKNAAEFNGAYYPATLDEISKLDLTDIPHLFS